MSLRIEVDISGAISFESEWHEQVADLREDLDDVALLSCKEGVAIVQEDHPYTDRTYQLTETAHAERGDEEGEAEMVWPKAYAGFVDGKDAFNFTDKAIEKAEETLTEGTRVAVNRFANRG